MGWQDGVQEIEPGCHGGIMNGYNLVALLFLTAPLALSTQQPVPAAGSDSAARRCFWRPRCSTPGLTLALQEIKRETTAGRTSVEYRLLPAGFPRDRIFTVWAWPVGSKPVALVTGFSPDSTGALVCGDSTTLRASARAKVEWCAGFPLASVTWAARGYMLGERYRLALVATDETVRAYGEAYPFPLESTAAGCRLSLELIHPHAFWVWGAGFEPGGMVRIVSRSGDEVVSDSVQVLPDSTLPLRLILPAVKGKRGGKATYRVEGSGCRVEITYPWGNALNPR